MKSNGSKFSKLLAGLVAASAIMPAIGVVNTSAMEEKDTSFMKGVDTTMKYTEITSKFIPKINIDGLNSSDVVEALHQLVPSALALLSVEGHFQEPSIKIDDYLTNRCLDNRLPDKVYSLLMLAITPRGGNDPNFKLATAITKRDEQSKVLAKLIEELARNYCKVNLGLENIKTIF